ncbi:ABC-type multidrug transport system ATPase subunit [Clostridium tetanomorphum]|uniref:ATP-binding cassette domain-containing protein n=1 Tax=Clostridium tetanomorphum TaxID=1553 RepID=A0A923EAE7_CLOTT|nr:ATP-binding cassette domain-containing protein [Clostridium tetanomorphum]KAJ52615.1 ABC transporter ATP-binding protein [Clostridium tetanomorphum DSM 665]MBC2396830.1 ATP-binding cassette domain-containing protein [Clostridium tetanomorphum]MBP1863208.1 ABC-type multidrug transport system ATPase subunit [Clostridium tetanomorphum]NRS84316.1 ABC-type multidrug transport system ATPase subunit [Clostridium tetanomorphum]NRZ97530.1 ABC-type multidrug transport system ATPase subunit [Clostridi
MENIMEIKRVSKKIKGRTIIDNMSFEIKKGQICGFIGPNGAGKTTMIRLLTGLIKPNEGEILINGIDVTNNRKEALINLGAIVESPIFFNYMTGKEVLSNLIRLHPNIPKKKRENRVEEVLKIVNLDKRGNDKVSTYSLGMKQRLGIAQALLGNPEIIILDEPANGLDPIGMKDLREIILKLNREYNITFLVSSHLLDELQKMCTNFVIINEGSLKFKGTSKDLFSIGSGNIEDIFIKILDSQEALA